MRRRRSTIPFRLMAGQGGRNNMGGRSLRKAIGRRGGERREKKLLPNKGKRGIASSKNEKEKGSCRVLRRSCHSRGGNSGKRAFGEKKGGVFMRERLNDRRRRREDILKHKKGKHKGPSRGNRKESTVFCAVSISQQKRITAAAYREFRKKRSQRKNLSGRRRLSPWRWEKV